MVLSINLSSFSEENISEAFKTLEVYQKSLEAERERCIKTVKEGITVEIATSITRKLRKLYAVTQKNMDLLDRAIVESYVENFPTESTRIHMGRMAPVEPPPPKKKKLTAKQKLKLKQKKAKAKGKPGRKKGVIQMNGAPVYAEVNYGGKKRKKAAREVELIDVSEDDEYYAPKKKSRPGPASSKKKAGPKSKTYYWPDHPYFYMQNNKGNFLSKPCFSDLFKLSFDIFFQIASQHLFLLLNWTLCNTTEKCLKKRFFLIQSQNFQIANLME